MGRKRANEAGPKKGKIRAKTENKGQKRPKMGRKGEGPKKNKGPKKGTQETKKGQKKGK